MYHEHRSWGLFFFRIAEIFIAINIVLLDIFFFHNIIGASTTSPVATTIIAPTPTPTTLTPPSPQQTPSSATTTTIVNQISGAKEIFIPIGEGQITATDWTNVPGALVTIDSTKYGNIKQIVFEASLQSTNNQIMWVRLYNTTDNHPVWYSEMSTNASSQFVTSQPIQLDQGNKFYQVQMKSQLQYPIVLNQARIHMTLQ